MTEENQTPETSGVSRRTVTKAMAWAVPAVAVAASVPAFAASGPPPQVLVGTACKLPGNSVEQQCATVANGFFGGDLSKAFAIPLLVTNNTSKTIVLKGDNPDGAVLPDCGTAPDWNVTIFNVRHPDGSAALPFDVKGIVPLYGTSLLPTASTEILVYANSNNSANDDVLFDLKLWWGHDCDDTDHGPIIIYDNYAPAFPPCSSKIPFPQGAPTCFPPFYEAVAPL